MNKGFYVEVHKHRLLIMYNMLQVYRISCVPIFSKTINNPQYMFIFLYFIEFIEIYRVNSNIYLAWHRGYRYIELTPIFILHGI